MIYTYAIIDSNLKVGNPINGLEDTLVYNIPYRDVGVAVSKLKEEIKDITQDHILKHEEVVEKLMEDFTVLPVKFLTVFKREKNVLLMMEKYYIDFKENLDRLRNKVEFGVRVIWPGELIKNRIVDAYKKSEARIAVSDNSAVNPVRDTNSRIEKGKISNGVKSFVKEKFDNYKINKEFEDEADKCIALIDDFFSRFIAEKKLEKLKSDKLLLSASYLVEKDRQADFKEAFERTRTTPGDLKFLCSGPWPPYNFIILKKRTDMFTPLEIPKTIGNTDF